MADNGIDAYIIPSNDSHQSEYVAAHWNSREWISGFTGSAGTIVVTADDAGLWTDSRYFLQAEQELQGTGISLHKPKDRYAPEHISWLSKTLPSRSVVGMDGDLCTIAQRARYSAIFATKDIKLNLSEDLLDRIWKDRPPLPTDPIYEHDLQYAGKSRAEKRTQLPHVN